MVTSPHASHLITLRIHGYATSTASLGGRDARRLGFTRPLSPFIRELVDTSQAFEGRSDR
jgi:hypothetical protein